MNAIVANIASIVITTISSTRVKAEIVFLRPRGLRPVLYEFVFSWFYKLRNKKIKLFFI